MLVASISLQAYSVWTLRDAINFRELWHYVASGFATLPLGVWLLLNTPLRLHTLSLGLFLCAYAAYMLLRKPTRATVDHTAGRLAVGALGGITGATAAFPGAFVTIWCSRRGWDKDRQRGIYQPYIFVMQLGALACLWAVRPADTFRFDLLIYALPGLAGAWCGLRLYRRLATAQFQQWVCLLLLVSGLLLVFASI